MGSLYAKLYSFTEAEVQNIANTIEDNRWAANLKAQKDYIYNRLLQTFPSPDEFSNIMQTRAIPRYEEYVNPNHPKAAKALAKMRTNLPTAYDSWKKGVDDALGPNGYFGDRVDAAAQSDKWSKRVVPALMIVGAPEIGPGPAPKLVWLLEGYDITQFLRSDVGEVASDTLQNKPIISPAPPYAVATVNALLVDAVRWHYGLMKAGLDRDAASYLTNMQNAISNFVSALLNPNLQLDGFVIAYESNTGRYRVEISISDKTA